MVCKYCGEEIRNELELIRRELEDFHFLCYLKYCNKNVQQKIQSVNQFTLKRNIQKCN